MLEEPRPHDVGGHFGEDASLLVVPAVSVGLVLLACAGGSHGAVQAVPCRTKERFRTGLNSQLVQCTSNSLTCGPFVRRSAIKREEISFGMFYAHVTLDVLPFCLK